MKLFHILILLFIISMIGFVFYSLSGGLSDKEYAHSIQQEREVKDAFMKNDNDSPFRSVKTQTEKEVTDNTEIIAPLKYFPADLK